MKKLIISKTKTLSANVILDMDSESGKFIRRVNKRLEDWWIYSLNNEKVLCFLLKFEMQKKTNTYKHDVLSLHHMFQNSKYWIGCS